MAGKRIEHYFQGKCKWAKLVKPDIEYRCWSVVLYLTQASYDEFMKLKEGTDNCEGILNDVKKDEDGYFVTFRRPMEKTYKGKVQPFLPPVLLDSNNLPWQQNVGIGNGSDLTIKVEWYAFQPPFKKKKGSAIRMMSCRVDNLVPYEIKKDFTEPELKAVEGLAEQPKQLF